MSLNQTLKKLRSKVVGLEAVVSDHRQDYMDFFGIWIHEDEVGFNQFTSSCRDVDPEDWA